ncbi:MAG: hypothetical protein ACQEQG_10115 [Bacillota bacterium]
MAKVTGPLMSMTASGKAGDDFIFYTVAGETRVKSYGQPNPGNSSAQQKSRQRFARSNQLYRLLNSQDKQAWNCLAEERSYSGQNLFVKLAMQSLKLTDTFLPVYNISAAEVNSDQVNVEFEVPQACTLKLYLSTDRHDFKQAAEIEAQAEKINQYSLQGLVEATTHHFYFRKELTGEEDAKVIIAASGLYSFSLS